GGKQGHVNQNCQYNLMVLLTRQAPTGLGNAGAWFGFAALATVIVALLVANRLGHRIARPLQLTQAVTHRIASGDLDARAQVTGKEGPELVSLAESVNQMAASLSRAQRAQRQFLMSVSHDLRTPLTSVRGYAEALFDGTTQDVHRASEVILSEARRLERLVGDLLELAKLEAGGFSLDCGPVDLSLVAMEAAMAFEPEAERLGLHIELVVAPGARAGHRAEPDGAPTRGREEAVMCYADADRLAQVVANLVENALKYASSRVKVSAQSLGGRPALCVEDDGPGIPAEDLQRVFTRLYQSSAAASRKVGSGLGLAIVDELVHAMGGRAWAESPVTPGPGGARMWVALARYDAPTGNAPGRQAHRGLSDVGRQFRTGPSPA
ncbi:MAG TPA: HAMP domain-containing sensor histidine kinase, partial [Acidimicrobiales bacterium]|nr:HAMP domain-containing sensor histidine kinase [Acidimicrobiales bacterium]